MLILPIEVSIHAIYIIVHDFSNMYRQKIAYYSLVVFSKCKIHSPLKYMGVTSSTHGILYFSHVLGFLLHALPSFSLQDATRLLVFNFLGTATDL
jgi:hypothetical protein